ncbi:MAG: cysteine sulfinate desulfinase [Gammaproteobacteria bacterium RIFCSPHIGHO2_12_FULL_43_28]|nr:MAG: cysteine sulfinate desulfinase [Gammaproteobacteria bacterium RIFCSPHIGHO2_12_FULL_43_28]
MTSILTCKKDFPILQSKNRNKPLVYLDSASTAQKPHAVINALSHFYAHDYANIHRGIYELSERASVLYENVRVNVKRFINAKSEKEIVFLRGATEAINLIAQCYGRPQWQAGDEVIVSEMEHHSNIVPWLLLKEQIGIVLKVIPVSASGELDLDTYQTLFSARTKLVAVTHASNVLGTINPVNEMTAIAHAHSVPILIDGAQAVPHVAVDVAEIDCDFYVFSSHKMYGPSGIGVLYAKTKHLQNMPPYQGGGGMIETVSFNEVTFATIPQRFEAGTPDIAGVIAFGAALDYLTRIGMLSIYQHETSILNDAQAKLAMIPGLRMIGMAKNKVGVISFVLDHIHPHDVGTVLDHEGIAIRAGHHCAMPLMERFGLPATVRVSLGIYNNEKDIDALVEAIYLAKRLFD